MYLVIWKDTCVSYTVDVTVDFPLKIWHSPTKIDEKKANTFNEFINYVKLIQAFKKTLILFQTKGYF